MGDESGTLSAHKAIANNEKNAQSTSTSTSTKGIALRYNYVLQECLLVIRHARLLWALTTAGFLFAAACQWRARGPKEGKTSNSWVLLVTKVSIVHVPHRRVETLRGPHRHAPTGR